MVWFAYVVSPLGTIARRSQAVVLDIVDSEEEARKIVEELRLWTARLEIVEIASVAELYALAQLDPDIADVIRLRSGKLYAIVARWF